MRAVLGEPRHYTTENTSDVTRVSLDLRVIPEALFRSAHASPTGTVPFTLHRYYFTTAYCRPLRGYVLQYFGNNL